MPTQQSIERDDLGLAATAHEQLPRGYGRYTLLSLLGRGGMAEVYFAEQRGVGGFSKRLAIKRILPHLSADPAIVELFLREARIAARITHPNVVAIYDLGEAEGRYFMAMEYIEGLSWRDLRRRTADLGREVPLGLAVHLLAQAAEGLDAAHRLAADDGSPLRIVHRDISTDNLYCSRDGVAKILDFGIATAVDSLRITKTDEVRGKLPYMSFEQLEGLPLDGRNDLYSLAVSGWWLMSGRRPFDRATEAATVAAILRGEPPKLRAFRPDVPPALDALLHRTLSRDRDLRPATGKAFAAELLAAFPEGRSPSLRLLDDLDIRSPVVVNVAPPDPATEALTRVDRGTPAGPLERHDAVSTIVGRQRSALDAALDAPLTGATPPPRRRLSSRSIAALLGAVVVGAIAFATLVLRSPPPSGPVMADARPSPSPAPSPSPPVAQPPAAPPPTFAVNPADGARPDPALASDTDAGVAALPPPLVHRHAGPGPRPAPVAPVDAPPAPRTVVVEAPASVRWVGPSGELVARGNGTVPAEVRILAVDDVSGARVPVDTTGRSRVSWEALPRGALDVRVRPWAAVSLGARELGNTPFSPVEVVAGTYVVRLVYGGQERRVTVVVPAGGVGRVREDFGS